MKRIFIRSCSVAILGAACTLTSLFANMLVPGATVNPDTFNTAAGFVQLASTGQLNINPVPGTSFNATYDEYVGTDTNNVFCSGCLDFVIFAENAGPGIFERISTASFGSFLTDVGYFSPTMGGIVPNNVDRSANGNVIGFNFLGSSVTAGQDTATLVIETNATAYTTGTVSIQDGTSGFAAGFAPNSVPEPASLFLLGSGAVLIGFSKKLTGNRKKA